MSRFILLGGTALLFAAPALAGSPPRTAPLTPAELASACAAAGDVAEPLVSGGLTGCRNTTTGGAIACDAAGRCTDYFADPRLTSIRSFIDAHRAKP